MSAYHDNIDKTLEYLRENLPNTLVNVVPMLDLTQLSEINNGFVCSILHRFVHNLNITNSSVIVSR